MAVCWPSGWRAQGILWPHPPPEYILRSIDRTDVRNAKRYTRDDGQLMLRIGTGSDTLRVPIGDDADHWLKALRAK